MWEWWNTQSNGANISYFEFYAKMPEAVLKRKLKNKFGRLDDVHFKIVFAIMCTLYRPLQLKIVAGTVHAIPFRSIHERMQWNQQQQRRQQQQRA